MMTLTSLAIAFASLAPQSQEIIVIPVEKAPLAPEFGVHATVSTPGVSRPDPATGIPMVTIGDPGNSADSSSGLGATPFPYRITTFEITNTEYLEFLNSVAKLDTNGLFSALMTSSDRGGILQNGVSGDFVYTLKPDFANKPVNSMTWFDAARFCNWLHNGKPVGEQIAATTEDGAYDMSLTPAALARKPGALYYIPTHDEWYKAAYYDPFDPGADGSSSVDYWRYPTRSDAIPTKATADAFGDVTNAGANVANSDKGADWNGENGNVTTVGGTLSPGPWGTYDMGGNVNELTETLGTPITGPPVLQTRRLRGGDFSNVEVLMGSPAPFSGSLNMLAEGANIGFRIAALAPWFDLGSGLAGTNGVPVLSCDGLTVQGDLVTVTLSNALPGAICALVIGSNIINMPFSGGNLVPSPDLVFPNVPIDANGEVVLKIKWPGGIPAHSTSFWQYWIFDPAGPQGVSASNAMQATTP